VGVQGVSMTPDHCASIVQHDCGVQGVVSSCVAAFREWRGALLHSGVLEDHTDFHTAHSKREVHALSRVPSCAHVNNAGDADSSPGAPVDTSNALNVVTRQTGAVVADGGPRVLHACHATQGLNLEVLTQQIGEADPTTDL
jgi:hypothetical protein